MENSICKINKFIREDSGNKNDEFKEFFDTEVRKLKEKINDNIKGIVEERKKTLDDNSD